MEFELKDIYNYCIRDIFLCLYLNNGIYIEITNKYKGYDKVISYLTEKFNK